MTGTELARRLPSPIMNVVRLVAEGELLALVILAAILAWVGNRAVDSLPNVRAWGKRIGLGCFVGYVGLMTLFDGGLDADHLAGNAMRGLVGAAVSIGAAWVILAIATTAWSGTFGRALSVLRRRQLDAEIQRRQRQQAAEAERERQLSDEAYRRSAPQRQQAAEAEAERRASHHRESARRDEARARCEILYSLHAPDMKSRFSRKALEQFIEKYLSDDRSADEVERRAKELEQLIEHHLRQASPTKKVLTSRAAIHQWYVAEQQSIKQLEMEANIKATQLIRLRMAYDEKLDRLASEDQT